MAVPVTRPLPEAFQKPGLLSGGGINRAITRSALGGLLTQAWTLNNVWPTTLGFSNKGEENDSGFGVAPIITGTPVTGKVQGVAKFGTNYIFVKQGRVFKVPTGGGNETEITSGSPIFSTTARIRFELARGSILGTKQELLYMADTSGSNNPQYFNGSGLTELTVFNSPILGITFSKPVGMVNWLDRVVWFFHKDSDFKNYILASDYDDGNLYSTTQGSAQAFFQEIYPGQNNDWITGLAVVKRAGSDMDNQELIASKNFYSYISASRVIPGQSTPIQSFSRMAEIGAINHESLINFNNSVYMMSKQGIGNFDTGTTSGGVYALSYQDGARVNPLIQTASANSNFDQAFALHCPQRQVILWSMPGGIETTAGYEGYDYGESPNNFSIGLKYGVQTRDASQIVNCWFTVKNKGWGWSCGLVNDQDILFGDYMEGQLYKLFGSTEFQRNPAEPDVAVPFMSVYETGDMTLESSENEYKNLRDLILKWYVEAGIKCRVKIFWDGREEGLGQLYEIGKPGEGAVYGTAVYGTSLYSMKSVVPLSLSVSNGGRSVRIKIEWDSQIDGIRNLAALDSFIGTAQYGGRLARTY